MAGQSKPDRVPYLLVITRYGGSEVLLVRGDSLASVDAREQTRTAEQLVTGAHRKYGLDTYCLWTGFSGNSDGDSVLTNYAVLEVLEPNAPTPRGMFWASADSTNCSLSNADEAIIVRFRTDLERYRAERERAPFAQPGWIRDLFSWARRQLHPLGFRLTGGVWQLNSGPTFSLIRLQTNRAPVWFKATGEPNARELPISLALGRVVPRYVPPILAVHVRWNGWLSPQVPGALLSETSDRTTWEGTARGLAELQLDSIEKGTLLPKSGLRDFRVSALTRFVDPFIETARELMRRQEKHSPAPLTAGELASLGDSVREALERVANLGIPDSIGRIDLNPENVVVSHGRAVFLDWAETYWGHPFLSFAYLLECFRRSGSDRTSDPSFQLSYETPWLRACAPANVSEALTLAPLIAAFAYAATGRGSRAAETRCDARAAGFVRSMARRMHREARLVEESRETCLP